MTFTTIEAEGLTKRFGSVPAVDGIDLDLGPGVTCVLGPNGAGKSTLLRMLGTVLEPDDGTLRLLGEDPQRAAGRLAVRRQLGYLPQQPGLYLRFSAYDLVDYVAVLKEITDPAVRRDEVRRVIAAVGLEDQMHRRIRQLSGGMRQRVAIAATLLGAPSLLVLDEPGESLDPEQRMRLRSLVTEAGRTGTVVVSTHQTADAAAMCHRVVVMAGGRITFVGTPTELAAAADGRVWLDERADGSAVASWATPDGAIRHVGEPPAGATVAAATIEDGYLLTVHGGER